MVKNRQFDKNIFSLSVPTVIIMVGFYAGGVLGILYGLSAILSFIAFRYPVGAGSDCFCSETDRRTRVDKFMDIINGNWFVVNSQVQEAKKNNKVLFAKMQVLRSMVTGLLMPFSVFAAFLRNYSLDYAGAFVVIVLAIAISADRSHTWRKSKDYYFMLHMTRMLVLNKFDKFESLYSKYPQVGVNSRLEFLKMTACNDNVSAMKYVMKNYRPELNDEDVQSLLDVAVEQDAQKAIAYIFSLGFTVRINMYAHDEQSDCVLAQ